MVVVGKNFNGIEYKGYGIKRNKYYVNMTGKRDPSESISSGCLSLAVKTQVNIPTNRIRVAGFDIHL